MLVKTTDLSGDQLNRFMKLAVQDKTNTDLTSAWGSITSLFYRELRGLEFWVLEKPGSKENGYETVHFGAMFKEYVDFGATPLVAICRAVVGGTFGEEVDTENVSLEKMKAFNPAFFGYYHHQSSSSPPPPPPPALTKISNTVGSGRGSVTILSPNPKSEITSPSHAAALYMSGNSTPSSAPTSNTRAEDDFYSGYGHM